MNGKTSLVQGLEDLVLSRWQCKDSTQSLSEFQVFFGRNRKADPQIYIELQGTLSSQNNLKQRTKLEDTS